MGGPKTRTRANQEESSVKALDSLRAPESGPIYTLHVASFLKENDAITLAESLRSRGYPASVTKVEVYGRVTLHRVTVGRFKTTEEARIFGLELERQEQEIKSFFIALVN